MDGAPVGARGSVGAGDRVGAGDTECVGPSENVGDGRNRLQLPTPILTEVMVATAFLLRHLLRKAK